MRRSPPPILRRIRRRLVADNLRIKPEIATAAFGSLAMTMLNSSDAMVLSFSPHFQTILRARGFKEPEKIQRFLETSLDHLDDPLLMKGMPEAVDRIRKACANQEPLLIHGDYDVDGVTATALLAGTFKILNAKFSTFLPDRTEDGYGVSEKTIAEAVKNGIKLLVTADCGITAHRAIDLARQSGMDVIVIDHHRVPEQGVPNATIILNPQQKDCAYRFKELSAAGLAFKLSYALIGKRAFQFLDLAALSTVCDVAPLIEENRVIVKKGLEILSERTNLGVRAMAEAGSVKTRYFNVGHVGFMLGPRINAAGRMSSPDIALRLLTTENFKEAQSLAKILEEENRVRQREERETTQEAITQVERFFNFNRDRVIVVARQGWHAGVIGIVASRLVERFHRPSVVIALDGKKGKGSGRSIKGFHLFNALDACKDLFEEFGGHEQAAGLSILEDHVTDFRNQINHYAREQYDSRVFVRNIAVDLEIGLDDLRTSFLKELELLEPCGAGNPRPVFMTKHLEIKNRPERMYGDTWKFHVTDGIFTYEAHWNDRTGDVNARVQKGKKIHLAYSVKTKVWEGINAFILDAKEIIPQD